MRTREVQYLNWSGDVLIFDTGVPDEMSRKESFVQNTAITSEVYAVQHNSSLICESQTANPKKCHTHTNVTPSPWNRCKITVFVHIESNSWSIFTKQKALMIHPSMKWEDYAKKKLERSSLDSFPRVGHFIPNSSKIILFLRNVSQRWDTRSKHISNIFITKLNSWKKNEHHWTSETWDWVLTRSLGRTKCADDMLEMRIVKNGSNVQIKVEMNVIV